jgi:hypothetical protein
MLHAERLTAQAGVGFLHCLRLARRLPLTACLPPRAHSVETVVCWPFTAALSVCHERVAHFTRLGYSRTPAKTASLPRSAVSAGSFGSDVTSWWNRSKSSFASRDRLALQDVGHHRRRRARDGAPGALEGHGPDHVTLELDEQPQPVAAQRVEPFARAVGILHLPEIPRPAVVVEDDLLVELSEV